VETGNGACAQVRDAAVRTASEDRGAQPRVPGGSLREQVNGLCLAGGLEPPAAGRPCAGEATRSSTLPVASGAPFSPFSSLLLKLFVVAPQAAEAASGRVRRSVGKG
jgi:hypothetical protein